MAGLRVRRPPIVWLLWIAVLGAVIGAGKVTDTYGGGSYWPQLAAGFAASLGAFVLALSWESDRERKRLERDAGAASEKREQEVRDLEARLATEVRRRFAPIRGELERNLASQTLAESYSRIAAPGQVHVLHPELLDGAWAANAPRLTELVADYELTSKLASTYGRIEELRWRLRQRTATLAVTAGSEIAQPVAAALEDMTKPLVAELLDEVRHIHERVSGEIENPHIQPLGLLHFDAATVNIRVTASGSGAE